MEDQESLQAKLDSFLLPRLRVLCRGLKPPLYIVGGLVRDWVRAAESWEKDVDIVTTGEISLLAQQAASLLQGRSFPLDQNTWRVTFHEAGSRWQMDICSLRGGDISVDLKHRDFTINALALEITEGAAPLHDPLQGRVDLDSGQIRWCNPNCFRDDPLRLLRAVRFSAQMGFSVERKTLEGMRESSALLGSVSKERIRDEFCKILSQPRSASYVRTLKDLALLDEVVPGLASMDQVTQGWPHRFLLWDHSLASLQALESILPEMRETIPEWSSSIEGHLRERLEGEIDASQTLKFVALLHDIGKPPTRMEEEGGRVRFFGHEEQGRAKISEICRSLRLGNRVKVRAEALVGSHLRPLLLASEEQLTTRAKYRFFRDLGELGMDLLLLGWADLRATVNEEDSHLDCYSCFVREMLRYYFEEVQAQDKRVPLIRGTDIMAALRIPPGPLIGDLLEKIREAEAEGVFQTREEGLRYLKERFGDWLRTGGKLIDMG